MNSLLSTEMEPFERQWASGKTLEKCRRELQEVLEDWLLLKLHDGDSLPVIDGIDLNLKRA
jgi:predicted RNase H-like HicB family nuclease